MSSNREEIINNIRKDRIPYDWKNIAEYIKKNYKDVTYADYCDILNDFFCNSRDIDYPFTPVAFRQLCLSWMKVYQPKHILIPFADGSEGILGDNVEYCFHNKDYEEQAKSFMLINTLEGIPSKGEYDFIVSDLPLGPITGRFIGCQTVEKCASILSNDGYCAFTFSIGVTTGEGRRWVSKLEEIGLYCNAVLNMPINSYGRMTSVETVVVILSKHKTDKLFIGLLSDEKIIEGIVDNFKSNRVSNTNAKMGVYAEGDVYSYADYQKTIAIQKKTSALNKAYNATSVKISDIGVVHAPDRDNCFEKNANSVFIPKLGNSDVVLSEEEFNIKAQNYFQVIVDDNKILPRYLAFFLNTEEGMKLRLLHYRGATIKAFNTKIIGEMEIPCPSVELQTEYLSTIDELEVLRIEVEKLKDRMQKTPASYKNIRKEMKDVNNHGDKFVQWIESLPYPIATILKRYSVTEELSKRQEMLLYFFEAYSIFESTILSAATNKDMIDCSSLNSVDANFFEKASFGNWVKMDRALSKMYLDMINGNDDMTKKIALSCFHTEDENFIKLLCNKTVCNVLEQASEKRNLWKGHGGITNDAIYKEHVDTLDSLMRKIQDNIKDLYERIRLIRPIGLTFNNGLFTNKVEVLTGSNPIFSKEEIVSIYALDNTKLYLQIMDTGEMLELPPYFILKNSPADAKNACYFYSRIEGGNTRYVSYHFDGKPEDLEDGEAAFDNIKKLLSN